MKLATQALAGLALAGALIGGPLAAPAFAQEAPAQAAADVAAPAPGGVAAAAPAEAAPAATAPAEAPAPTPDKGDTTWMLISTVLVLLMIVPGLALFYGGLVRQKNMLSMLMQVSTVTVVGMMAWVLWGYSLAFTDGGGLDKIVGGFGRLFLRDVTPASNVATFSTGVVIPELAFIAFQMTFACITAALVLGGVAERMKFAAVLMFAILWPILSYYPLAHMVWWWAGPDAVAAAPSDPIQSGLIWGFGAIDFAGGTVVHINAGVAALVGALILGARKGYRSEPMPPHSLTLTLVGAGLLWVGWFGFNAGSNLEANGYAALAMVNTFIATAAAGFSWTLTEWITRKKASMLGMASGLVAGLVAVTPAAGFAGPVGALVLGLIVSPICVVFCSAVKNALKYDDSLDAFGIHGIGGIVGAIATGILVAPALGGAGIVDYTTCAADGDISTCDAATYAMATQVIAQLKGVLVSIVWSAVASAIVFFLIKFTVGLRVNEDTEEEGLDIVEHGERAYHS
ncbi:ammonium transporter [Phenylobacterium sp.]|uniref:ammonium transporter n=1 Tax=Phenylobacterium sp. TaxID=1871053 RepID=UPI002F946571